MPIVFPRNGCHLAKIFPWLSKFGNFLTTLHDGKSSSDEFEEIDILISFPNNGVSVFVNFFIRVNQVGRQTFLMGDCPAHGLIDTRNPLTYLLQGRISERSHAFLDGNFAQLIFGFQPRDDPRLGDEHRAPGVQAL